MASNVHLGTAYRNGALDGGNALLNSGKIKVYGGGSGQPANAQTAITDQTLLCTLTLNATAFAAASSASAAANSITADTSAVAAGTPTWARITNSAGSTTYMDVSAGTSGTDLVLTFPAGGSDIAVGDKVTASSLTISIGA